MNFARTLLFGLTVLSASIRLAAKEEVLALYEDHRVVINVPEGSTLTRSFSDLGIITVKIVDAKQVTNLEISLLPDPEGRFTTPRARREFIVETFQQYVEGSTEKEIHFTEQKTRTGAVTACVFTDANLVGKTDLPPNEYLNATTGMKTWPGCAAYFTLLSNGVDSPAYQAAMKIITESVQDQKPPPAL